MERPSKGGSYTRLKSGALRREGGTAMPERDRRPRRAAKAGAKAPAETGKAAREPTRTNQGAK